MCACPFLPRPPPPLRNELEILADALRGVMKLTVLAWVTALAVSVTWSHAHATSDNDADEQKREDGRSVFRQLLYLLPGDAHTYQLNCTRLCPDDAAHYERLLRQQDDALLRWREELLEVLDGASRDLDDETRDATAHLARRSDVAPGAAGEAGRARRFLQRCHNRVHRVVRRLTERVRRDEDAVGTTAATLDADGGAGGWRCWRTHCPRTLPERTFSLDRHRAALNTLHNTLAAEVSRAWTARLHRLDAACDGALRAIVPHHAQGDVEAREPYAVLEEWERREAAESGVSSDGSASVPGDADQRVVVVEVEVAGTTNASTVFPLPPMQMTKEEKTKREGMRPEGKRRRTREEGWTNEAAVEEKTTETQEGKAEEETKSEVGTTETEGRGAEEPRRPLGEGRNGRVRAWFRRLFRSSPEAATQRQPDGPIDGKGRRSHTSSTTPSPSSASESDGGRSASTGHSESSLHHRKGERGNLSRRHLRSPWHTRRTRETPLIQERHGPASSGHATPASTAHGSSVTLQSRPSARIGAVYCELARMQTIVHTSMHDRRLHMPSEPPQTA